MNYNVVVYVWSVMKGTGHWFMVVGYMELYSFELFLDIFL